MNRKHHSKRARRTRLPVELYAYGLIALMWLAILAGATITKAEQPESDQTVSTPQQTSFVEAKAPRERITADMLSWKHTYVPVQTETVEPEPVEEEIKRTYYDCPFDQSLQDYLYDLMEKFGIDLDIAWPLGMVWNESRFDQYACGAANDMGYFQIIPGTYQYIYPKVTAAYPELNLVDDVYNPHTNIACALYYMRIIADDDSLGEVNEGNIHHVLTCYNRGPGGGWKYYKAHGYWESDYGQRIEAIKSIIIAEGTTANIRM